MEGFKPKRLSAYRVPEKLVGKNAQKALVGYNPVSDRILLARFKLFVEYLVVIQIYAPTSKAPQQDIDSFYRQIQEMLANGIIRPSENPMASPLVCVLKGKNGCVPHVKTDSCEVILERFLIQRP